MAAVAVLGLRWSVPKHLGPALGLGPPLWLSLVLVTCAGLHGACYGSDGEWQPLDEPLAEGQGWEALVPVESKVISAAAVCFLFDSSHARQRSGLPG